MEEHRGGGPTRAGLAALTPRSKASKREKLRWSHQLLNPQSLQWEKQPPPADRRNPVYRQPARGPSAANGDDEHDRPRARMPEYRSRTHPRSELSHRLLILGY